MEIFTIQKLFPMNWYFQIRNWKFKFTKEFALEGLSQTQVETDFKTAFPKQHHIHQGHFGHY